MSLCGFHREKQMLEARKKGRLAQDAGAPISDNPFKRVSPELKYAWDQGYLAQELEKEKRNATQ